MSEKSENNKRIAKNTLALYARMLFTMAVSLYTSRVVLNTLGVRTTDCTTWWAVSWRCFPFSMPPWPRPRSAT